MIRNLPGLLEVLVLSRLNMRQGASYAITTILNYIIIAVGAMTVFGSLGVSWDKLQYGRSIIRRSWFWFTRNFR